MRAVLQGVLPLVGYTMFELISGDNPCYMYTYGWIVIFCIYVAKLTRISCLPGYYSEVVEYLVWF